MLADHSTEVAYVYNLLDEESGISGRGTYIIDPDGIIRSIEVT
ncbi:redoxin domain-containing protein [bacterium]|jgi:peroxiredoxin (alkyl hydroperoxide reductase subunit C)|nr:redoxin domain-containing protein [bacterium]MBT3852965.1 redoxin domain-containing protein [bacterium]MBT4633254.1 redoxin domain-containing protein [bacterium]MBT6779012.1 redoxin domain-containing protein [bacterium]